MGFSPLMDQSSGYQGGSEASCFYDDTKKKRTNIKLREKKDEVYALVKVLSFTQNTTAKEVFNILNNLSRSKRGKAEV